LFSVLSHAFSRGRRDFTSSSQIVAGQYAILCAPEQAGTAARLLAASPVGVGLSGAAVVAAVRVPTAPVVAPPVVLPRAGEPSATGGDQVGVGQVGSPTTIAPAGAAPAEPRKVDARWLTEDGKPRYGALAADHPDPVVVSTVAVPAVEGGEAPEPVAPPTQPGQPVVAVVSADESAVQKASVPDNPYAPPPANRR
ncbi:MAG: hypothetical protein LBB58_02155, partial [Cellulomonadaceae bacterium]|nr:hypothetical protein [Cellulomonadaceae bacterium]